MFTTLTEKIEKVFKQLRGQAVLTEENITDALKEVRLALLEADVNFKIVKDFIEKVRVKAVGQEVLKSLTPAHQMVKVVWEELRDLLGHEQSALHLSSQPPTVIMMVGLQGSGKTTTTGKLANYFKTEGKRVLLVAADPRRPAAGDQLASLGTDLDIPVHRGTNEGQPGAQAVQTCRDGVARGRDHGYDVVLLDTGGRLHIDEELMQELVDIQTGVQPQEILLIADSMTGQEAVSVAERFNQTLGLTGVILTKVEGDARGGAVLSIRAATGKPIKFLGIGEKLDALEPFYPDRMASRILGMGDVLTLVEEIEGKVNRDKAEKLAKKIGKGRGFDLADLRDQFEQMLNMGGMAKMLEKLPLAGKVNTAALNGAANEEQMRRQMAIIDSMTPGERRFPKVINGSRKRRIAVGSGQQIQDVNRLLKQHLQMEKMMKKMSKGGMKKMLRGLPGGGMPPGPR